MDTLRNNRNCESSIENSSSIFTGNEIKGDGTSPDRNGLWINRSKRVVFREEKNYNNNNWVSKRLLWDIKNFIIIISSRLQK